MFIDILFITQKGMIHITNLHALQYIYNFRLKAA